jgi:broad-specificity NMP kinase
MKPEDSHARAYVLVEIQPGKEKDFSDEVLSKGLILDSKVERMDFVHGSFDFVIILRGAMKDIDARVMEIRKSPFVRRTETLICFEMFTWEDLSGRLNE